MRGQSSCSIGQFIRETDDRVRKSCYSTSLKGESPVDTLAFQAVCPGLTSSRTVGLSDRSQTAQTRCLLSVSSFQYIFVVTASSHKPVKRPVRSATASAQRENITAHIQAHARKLARSLAQSHQSLPMLHVHPTSPTQCFF